MSRDGAGEGRRVAVVQSDPFMLRALGNALNMSGFRTRLFENPWEAMAELGPADADVVIVERDMPRCSGPELAAGLRQRWDGAGPALVLFGSRLTELPEQQREPFDLLLEEPIRPGELLAAIGALWRGRRRSGTQAKAGADGSDDTSGEASGG